MRTLSTALLFCLMISIWTIIIPVDGNTTVVGVKEGDWMEYNVTIVGNPPSVHRNLTGMRMDVFRVDGAAFQVNMTEKYANNTLRSLTWDFNFTAGNTEGWLIIPANLSPGDTFFDNYSKTDKNVLVQGQEQKTVLGATRTITFSNDSYRVKFWDKDTGVFVASTEVFKNWSAYATMTSTNLWRSELEQSNQSNFYPLVITVLLSGAILASIAFVARRKHFVLSSKQKKITGAVLLLAFIGAIGLITSTPISENQVPLSFRDLNVIMQSLWMSLLLVSMWFRKKGNYLIHGILLIAVVSITIVSFIGVLVMSPMNNSSMQEYFGSPVDVTVFFAHAIFSFPALLFGLWLIALWRPYSSSYLAKSKKISWLLTVFWVLSYIVGILDYLIIRIHLFG